jgi:lipopolysaccharide/colanic/teichoic acid biosynthesis glycosyltransferase
VDIVGSLAGLGVLLVLLPWAAAAILIDSGRPIFFRQSRLGVGGRSFEIIKLRTMRQDAEADGQAHWAATTDPRATRVGRVLRRTHLDEFPQFWSVLRGDMSLVGPRPERPELVAELEKQIPLPGPAVGRRASRVGPGQLWEGPPEGSAEKLEYDLYYIKHRGLWLDLWVLLRTIGPVLRLRGV